MKNQAFGLLLAATVALPLAAHAAPPGAGNLLQQVQPPAPAPPASSETGLKIEQPKPEALPDSTPFQVKRLVIVGNTLAATDALHALVADLEGKDMTLPQLDHAAGRITDWYRQHHYMLSRALIPEQRIEDGVVTIQVVEARYDRVTLDNHSRVDEGLLAATLAPLQAGGAVEQASLDQALLLLSDIPGVAVRARLSPGASVGTSDLQVDTQAAPAWNARLAADNYGNESTGRARLGGTLNLVEPLRRGDFLSLDALTSGGMTYGRASYEMLLNGLGTRVGASASDVAYRLGGALKSLDGSGSASVYSAWAKEPLVRTPAFNLYGQIEYDRKQLDDTLKASGIVNDRHLDNFVASLATDVQDGWLAGGVSSASLSLTLGELNFDDAQAKLSDLQTANAGGGFTKLVLSLTREQALGAGNSLYVSFTGQWAGRNLDSAEKMMAGGPFTVRAYDMSALAGDAGYLETIEYRYDLPAAGLGQWRAVIFGDSQQLSINHQPWSAGGNAPTLSDAGAGVNWQGPARFAAKAYVAAPVGAAPALLSRGVRGWIELSKAF